MSRIISGKIRLNVQRVELGSVVEAETVRLSAEASSPQQVLDPLLVSYQVTQHACSR